MAYAHLDFTFQRGRNTMRKINWSSILCIAVIIICFGAVTFGQEVTGTISGTVVDPNGAAVANASVTVANGATGLTRNFQTNDDGTFLATLLPPGVYSITVENAGFKKYVQQDLELNVNDR